MKREHGAGVTMVQCNPKRLTFDELTTMQDQLELRYLRGTLSADELQRYVSEWDQLLVFAGWSWDEYLLEIDVSWERSRRTFDVSQC